MSRTSIFAHDQSNRHSWFLTVAAANQPFPIRYNIRAPITEKAPEPTVTAPVIKLSI